MKTILVVEDRPSVREAVIISLSRRGYRLFEAESKSEAIQLLDHHPDLVILDLSIPEHPGGTDKIKHGLALLEDINKRISSIEVYIMTATAEFDSILLEAFQKGASFLILKTGDDWITPLADKVDDFFRKEDLAEEGMRARERRIREFSRCRILGSSPVIENVRENIKKAAVTDAPVLILGETGTGKELVALSIHAQSSRKNKLFKAINCCAVPASLIESELFGHEKGAFTDAHERRKGCFEESEGGTLFIDEIGDMPIEIQPKLLRTIQGKKPTFKRLGGKDENVSDVRLIYATRQDLKKRMSEGMFREDLYYRINVFPIYLPPLRERREDIPILAQHFLDLLNYERKRNTHLTPDCLETLRNHSWPGNVRELENCIERLVINAPSDDSELESSDLWIDVPFDSAALPVEIGQAVNQIIDSVVSRKIRLVEAYPQFEVLVLRKCLELEGGNVTQAAKRVGISRENFSRKKKIYGL